MKNKLKYFLLIPVFTLMMATSASAALLKGDVLNKMDAQTTQTASVAGYEDVSVFEIVANIIKIALGLLGIIFLVLIIFSGYQWMMAGGDENVITAAKGRIKNAVIGVVIVLAAYSITNFVFSNLDFGGQGGTSTQEVEGSGGAAGA